MTKSDFWGPDLGPEPKNVNKNMHMIENEWELFGQCVLTLLSHCFHICFILFPYYLHILVPGTQIWAPQIKFP